MKLYTYFRSSAAFRVRIALNLKGLAPEAVPVNLAPTHLEQDGAAFRTVNAQGLVPVLELDDGHRLSQSLAIVEYLEEVHPEPPLLPAEPLARAEVRATALALAADTHPLHNARVLRYLKSPLGHDQPAVDAWIAHWMGLGLAAVEARIDSDGFCHGGRVGLADICLVPQVASARRFGVDLAPFPRIRRVEERCLAMEAFARALPARQPDAI